MKMGKLKKLQMPKREEMDMSELELDMEAPEEAEGDMASEMAGESEGEESPMPGKKGMDKLAAVSDEDLLAELKKRGLMGQLGEEGEGEMELEEDEMYS